MKPSVLVLGSLNMDFVVQVEQLPAAGQTVLGKGLRMIPGGKGANQASAAGRLIAQGGLVRMVGRVGADVFANQLKDSLAAANVDVSSVTPCAEPTGTAFIWVDANGQNSIVVSSGANFAFDAKAAESLRPLFKEASHALFQLETPKAAVAAAMRVAQEEGVTTMLDPAPAQELSSDFLRHVDLLTPNESEACLLLDRPLGRITRGEASEVAIALMARGPKAVVLKLGDQGSFYCSHSDEIYCPAFPVNAVDSTAAGDVFNAALAVCLAEERTLESAMRFANAAAALSVTRLGAQSSIPTRTEVEDFLKV